MINSFKKIWINGLNFKDRTSRSDFWFSILSSIVVNGILGFILGFVGGIFEDLIGPLATLIVNLILVLYSIAYFIANLSLEVRRLHDVNKSGWYLLMGLIPLVGWIFVLIAFCSKTVEPNEYGKQI